MSNRNFPPAHVCRIKLDRNLKGGYQEDPERWADDTISFLRIKREEIHSSQHIALSWETNFDQLYEQHFGGFATGESWKPFWEYYPKLRQHHTALILDRRLDLMSMGIRTAMYSRHEYISNPNRMPPEYLSWVLINDFNAAVEESGSTFLWNPKLESRIGVYNEYLRSQGYGWLVENFMLRPYAIPNADGSEWAANAVFPNFQNSVNDFVTATRVGMGMLSANVLYHEMKTWYHEMQWDSTGTEIVTWGYPTRPEMKLHGPWPMPTQDMGPGMWSSIYNSIIQQLSFGNEFIVGATQFDNVDPPTDYDHIWNKNKVLGKASLLRGWPGS